MTKNIQHPPKQKRPSSAKPSGDLYWQALSFFYDIRGVFYGLVFLGYVWFVHPSLMAALSTARETGARFYLLGWVIIAIVALQPLGLWLKWPLVDERIRRWPVESFAAKFAVGVAQLTGIFLGMMVFLNTLPFFGESGMCFDYETRFVVCGLTNLTFFAILGKELFVLMIMLSAKKPSQPVDLDDPLAKKREMAGEVLLLVFAMVTFSLSWSGLVSALEPAQADEMWLTLFASALLFLMLYPASRVVFFAEEWLVRQPVWGRLLTILFFLSTMAAAILEVPGIR